ncbi:MAG: sigma-70 family RNA polymerase sigma factor [Xanthomonadales bacterium]|nr:sigma-70 family RNA polymerase sigma factor [Xanthomonadales bacterium]
MPRRPETPLLRALWSRCTRLLPAQRTRLLARHAPATLRAPGDVGAIMDDADRPESTATLLARVRDGDALAREQLCAQYLPILNRWAHGRLPVRARDLAETSDLVQVTLLRALARLHEFEPQREGAFLAYLRTVLLNVVRDEVRRSMRRGEHDSLDRDALAPDLVADDSELARVIGPELLVDYERALAELGPEWREAVILRLEFGFGYEEIAAAMLKPSADAARMLVTRAIRSLGERLAAH